MRLSLIVPCFNEQDNIFPFARAVAEVFPDPSDYEIVFVNDGSKDKTLQNLKELHRQSQQNIRVVSFSRNFGKESAIYAGLQHCDGEYISLIDADLQQDPAIVKQMTEILDAEPDTDCVCAFQETRHENKLMTSVKSAFLQNGYQYERGGFCGRCFRLSHLPPHRARRPAANAGVFPLFQGAVQLGGL